MKLSRRTSGAPHRFLEFESDSTGELEGLVARSVEKGWAEYVTGSRVGASQVQVVIFNNRAHGLLRILQQLNSFPLEFEDMRSTPEY